MSEKVTTNKKPTPAPLYDIAELARKFKVRPGVFAGVKVFKKWANGKHVTEKEFESALRAFGKAPVKVVN